MDFEFIRQGTLYSVHTQVGDGGTAHVQVTASELHRRIRAAERRQHDALYGNRTPDLDLMRERSERIAAGERELAQLRSELAS